MAGIPDIPEYPDEEGWSALKPALLERALTLRNQVRMGRRLVTTYAEIAVDDDEISHLEAGHIGLCGYMAWTLARDLRAAYRVRPLNLTKTFWDIEPILQGNHDRIIKERPEVHADAPEGKRKVRRTKFNIVSG